jgi:hypothetical protein
MEVPHTYSSLNDVTIAAYMLNFVLPSEQWIRKDREASNPGQILGIRLMQLFA